MGAAAKGREFEFEIAQFLRLAGFHVERNAGAARPRQTDIYAQSDDLYLLVEAKNQRRALDISDVDSLRARLNRTTSDVVGIFFTTSTLTRGAIKEIESNRTREILAITREEVALLRAGRQNLMALIERKRSELRTRGRFWIGVAPQSEFLDVPLPGGAIEFRLRKKTEPYFEAKTRAHASVSFALAVHDTGWGGPGGEGALLSLRLTLNGAHDLRNILGYLQDRFGLSANGSFSIHQSEASWHGAGAENFMQAVTHWRERYDRSQSRKFHHSEEMNYFDQVRDGWVALSLIQRVGLESARASGESFLHGSELAVQLPGVPVDMGPFLRLCRYTGNDWAQFQHVGERMTFTRRLKKPVALDIAGTVVNTDRDGDRIVVGVIAKNPFFLKHSLPQELRCDGASPFVNLEDSELLLCSLRDWHDEGDTADRYVLQGFEGTWAGRVQVVRAFGTWDNIIKRARKPDMTSSLEKMLLKAEIERKRG